MEECGGGAKLATFCKGVESLFVKLPPKEVLKELLRGYTTQSPNLN
jgi:hypothetical protein